MEGVLQTFALFAAVISVAWLAGNADQWVQKLRGAKPDEYGRVKDGPLAKTVLVLIIGGFFLAYAMWGGTGHPVDGCFGSMKC
jgi:hypothetical protein